MTSHNETGSRTENISVTRRLEANFYFLADNVLLHHDDDDNEDDDDDNDDIINIAAGLCRVRGVGERERERERVWTRCRPDVLVDCRS